MIVTSPRGAIGYEQIGAGRDLLLLHSLLTDRRVFDRILPTLSASRRVTLIDLPGYGDSDPVDPHIKHYADAIAHLAGALELNADLAIVGNGLGAFVALATAVHHPDQVGRLVLAGVATRFPDDARSAFDHLASGALTAGMSAIAETAVRRIFTDDFIAAHPDLADERRQVLQGMNPAGFAAGCRAIRDVDLTDRLGGVQAPTLVVVGSDDQATPPAYGREVADVIPGALYRELPNVAHGPQLQSPDQFLAAIEPFLDAP